MMRVPASTAKILRHVPLPDEVAVTHTKAVVLDVGAYSTRLGFAGDTAPRMNERTVVLSDNGAGQHATCCFDDAYKTWHSHMVKMLSSSSSGHDATTSSPSSSSLVHVIDQGMVADWDAYETLLQRIDDMLQLSNAELAAPLLVTEKALVPPTQRRRIAELLFEQHRLTALSFSLCPVLALYAAGLCTGVSVELGHDQCHVVPVYQGFGLFHAMHCMPFGGDALTRALAHASATPLPAAVVHPHRQLDVWAHLKHVHARTLSSHDAYLAATTSSSSSPTDMALAHIGNDGGATAGMSSEHDATAPQQQQQQHAAHRLPDGTVLQLGVERYLPSEALFYPALLPSHLCSAVDHSTMTQSERLHTAAPTRGVHELVVDAVRRCDADLTTQFLEHVLLSGGTSLLAHLPERLEAEVQAALSSTAATSSPPPLTSQQQQAAAAAHVRVRVRADAERRDAAFVGGSILASLPSFQHLWVRRGEYDEVGADAVVRGCL